MNTPAPIASRIPVRRPAIAPASPAAPVAKRPTKPALPASVQNLRSLVAAVRTSVVGRNTELDVLALALAARMNVLLLGVPGTAKTMLVRRLASGFCPPEEVFDILLTKFTKPAEVFGPADIVALEQGEVRFRTEGFLPSATVGVLDEVFKGGSPILNALLTIANERKFKNGASWEDCPTRMLVGMSNEFPEDASILAAFYDRFPLKLTVNYLDPKQFGEMLALVAAPASVDPLPSLSAADLAELDTLVDACEVPAEVLRAVVDIREMLRAKNVTGISDRRFGQAMRLIKASAVLAGRSVASRRDLAVLEYVCWNSEADRAVIKSILPAFLAPFEKDVRAVIDEVYAARKAVLDALNVAVPPAKSAPDSARPSPDLPRGTAEATRALRLIGSASTNLSLIEDQAESDSDRELFAAAGRSIEAVRSVVMSLCKGKDVVAALLADADQNVL